MGNMRYSKTGDALTKGFESCRLVAYYDSKGVLTIGWGHTGSVYPGMVITQEKADELLRGDYATAEAGVNRCVTVKITQNEFDALVDEFFNVGVTAMCGSTEIRLLNSGDYQGAAGEFAKWDHAGGKVIAGLLRRRIAERTLFEESEVCQ